MNAFFIKTLEVATVALALHYISRIAYQVDTANGAANGASSALSTRLDYCMAPAVSDETQYFEDMVSTVVKTLRRAYQPVPLKYKSWSLGRSAHNESTRQMTCAITETSLQCFTYAMRLPHLR